MEPTRCPWCLGFPQYVEYHDKEWGVPVHVDAFHFEFLILEIAQAGLSWSTILKKREGYREAFSDFNPELVANYDQRMVEELMRFPGIIRNKAKIQAAITNAKAFLEIQKEFGFFDKYIWKFVNNQPIINRLGSMKEAKATTPESDKLSKDLKKRGFKFLGSTTVYAHMQACGLVNDHLTDCFRWKEVQT